GDGLGNCPGLAKLLLAEEEEGLAIAVVEAGDKNRTADIVAKVGIAQSAAWNFRGDHLIEVRIGIENLAPEEAECPPMEDRCSGFGLHAGESGAGTAELRAI